MKSFNEWMLINENNMRRQFVRKEIWNYIVKGGSHAQIIDRAEKAKFAPADSEANIFRQEVIKILASTLGDHRGYLPGNTSEELLSALSEKSNLWPDINRMRDEESRYLDK